LLRQYETTFVVDAHLSNEQIESTIDKFTKFIEKNGVKIKNVDRWGKRRLAYEINKKQYGYYVYVRFEAEGTFIKTLERHYKLDEAILRYLTVLVPTVLLKEEERREKVKAREAAEKEAGKSSDQMKEGPSGEEVRDTGAAAEDAPPEQSEPQDEPKDVSPPAEDTGSSGDAKETAEEKEPTESSAEEEKADGPEDLSGETSEKPPEQ
jgi:small subunit ribosomal protein S6